MNGANVTAGNAVNITGSAVSISAAVNSQASDITGAGSRGFTRNAQSTQTATGGTITGGGNVLISATGAVAPVASATPTAPTTGTAPTAPASGSVTLSGAQLASLTGQAQITATGNVDIAHLNATQSITTESASRQSGFLSSTRTQQSNSTTVSQVVGSEISGNTVVIQAGVGQTAAQAKDTGSATGATSTGNINISGSTIVSSGGTTLKAPGDISIVSAQETTTSSNSYSQSRSGLLSGGGPSIMIGRTSNSSTGNSTETRQVGSTIAAGISADGKTPAAGNVIIDAGGDVRITSSNVIAQGHHVVHCAKLATGHQRARGHGCQRQTDSGHKPRWQRRHQRQQRHHQQRAGQLKWHQQHAEPQ
jgi:filamentous hemagglutinin